MNWELDNLTPEQERAIRQFDYVGAFHSVFLKRLLAAEPPKTEAAPPLTPDTDAQPPNTRISRSRTDPEWQIGKD